MFLSKLECLVNEFDSLLEFYYKIVEQEENDRSFVILSVGDKENTLCFQLVLNDIKEDYMEINFNSQERYLYEYIFLFYVVHFFNNMNLMIDEEAHELSNKFFVFISIVWLPIFSSLSVVSTFIVYCVFDFKFSNV